MRPTLRRGLATALTSVVLGTTAACGSGSGDTDTVLDIATQDKYANIPLLVAQDQGYLEELGIDSVNLLTFNSIPALTTAVAKGQADLGMQTVPVVESANRQGGVRMRFIDTAGMDILWWVQRDDPALEVAQGDNGWVDVVQAWQDRKIGIPALGGSMEKNLHAMLDGAGMAPTDIEIVPVGIGGAGLAALEQGLVDAVGGSSSSAGQVIVDGLGEVAMGGSAQPEQLAGTYTGGWFVTDSQAADRRDFYIGIVEASRRAKEFIADPVNKYEVVDSIVTHVGVSQEIAEIMYDLDHTGIGGSLGTREGMEKTLHTAVELGYMPGPVPPVDDLIHAGIWPGE